MAAVQTLRHRSSWKRVSPSRVVATLEIAPVGQPVRAEGTGRIDEVAYPPEPLVAITDPVDVSTMNAGDEP